MRERECMMSSKRIISGCGFSKSKAIPENV